MWVIPFNSAPDEWAHLDTVKRLLNYTYFSTSLDPRQFIITGYGQISVSYALLPPLSYIVAAPFAWFGQAAESSYMFARLGSALSMTLLTYVVYLFFTDLGAKKWVRYLGTSVIGFIPQLTFLGAYTNSDALSISLPFLVMTLAIFFYFRNQTKPAGVFIQGLLTGLAMLTRYNAYPILLGSLLIIILRLRQMQKLKCVLWLFWGLITTCGWWFLLGWFRGDITGVMHMYNLLKKVRPHEFPQIGVISLVFGTDWLWVTFKSSFAAFDWNSLFLPNMIYIILGAILLILLGKGFSLYFKLSEKYKTIFLVLAGSAILTFLQSIYQSAYGSYQPQGRHLLAGILPFGTLLIYIVFKNKPCPKILIISALAMLAINIYCLIAVLVPQYWAVSYAGLTKYRWAISEMTWQKPVFFSKSALITTLLLYSGFVLMQLYFLLRKLINSEFLEH